MADTATKAAWLGVAVYVAAADAALIRTHRQTMSSLARRHPGITSTVAVALTSHLLVSSRWDPLHLIGGALQPARR